MINNSSISVVVQGAIIEKVTRQCLDSIRYHLPGAEIILSTWKGALTNRLNFDVLIENEDPGAPFWHNLKTRNNTNRQIVSTKAGIKHAKRPFVLKLRSDAILTSSRFKNYFGMYKIRHPEWCIFQERILCSNVFSRLPTYPPFNLFCTSDWYHFGLRNDMEFLWDIPLYNEPETSLWFVHHPLPEDCPSKGAFSKYHPEQLFWLGCLRKFAPVSLEYHSDYSEEKKRLAELVLANNLVLLHPWQSGIHLPKYSEAEKYSEANPMIYNHMLWRDLYRKTVQMPIEPFPWSDRLKYIGHSLRSYIYFANGSLKRWIKGLIRYQ